MFELKSLSPDAVEAALEKALRYRLLNEPWQAESICRDVLEQEPDNQKALINLILALSDQFDDRSPPRVDGVRELIPRLGTEYEQKYYEGIICERRGTAYLRSGAPGCGPVVYDWLRRAMVLYEEAAALRPGGTDDPILRWNTCVRIIEKYPAVRPATDAPQPLLE